MKTKKKNYFYYYYIIIINILYIFSPLNILGREIPYTIEDRERLIRVETKLEEGLKAVNQRMDSLEKSLNQRIDDLYQLMLVLIGAIIAQTIGVIGFVLWDRRTAISPVIRKTKELEEDNEKIHKVLKEMAKNDNKIANILKQAGIL
ncbi:MAG: hypothetical protein KatS3mg129_2026 [Leptospiraceae bacterium]|nr:MAG: hypothetical protein KatS3mg129_2026 [Leptospiraceae bacterium]